MQVGFLESSLYPQNPGLTCNNSTALLKWNTDELSLTSILQNLFKHISKAQMELDDVSLTWTGKTHEDSCSMRTAGDTAALVSIEGAWKVFKYRTGVLSTNTPEKNPIFASFTVTLSSKWVKYKRIVFHLHPQMNSGQGGPWISYIICLLVTQGQSTAPQWEPKLWYRK